jgi:hypothetical protein
VKIEALTALAAKARFEEGINMTYLKKIATLALTIAFVFATAVAQAAPPPGKGGGKKGGFTALKKTQWDEFKVRKVLNILTYGGHATEAQIAAWGSMPPSKAIKEMLTFGFVNTKLSPSDGVDYSGFNSLEDLQDFWGDSGDLTNPININRIANYYPLSGSPLRFNHYRMQQTWTQLINTRGLNPFLHKVQLYLTNYHMSLSVFLTGGGLMRSYYDGMSAQLASDPGFARIVSYATRSAAASRAYGHLNNRFINDVFYGNDDLGREFHQLYMGIQGELEDPLYHENTTIEGTSRMLTGMHVDRDPTAYGGGVRDYVAPIVFTDHTDANGDFLTNEDHHHTACLEILNDGINTPNICGIVADAKIDALSDFAITNQESLDNLPVLIIGHFADDNLTDAKIETIRKAWAALSDKNLLDFLRAYAISTTFHSSDTYKFRSSFDRNLTVKNLNTLTNEESFGRSQLVYNRMRTEGVEVFEPIRNVFGHQTGIDAANNPNVFKDAYAANVVSPNFLSDTEQEYTNKPDGTLIWLKDWGAVIPTTGGQHIVEEVASWLWQRFIADGGKNYDPIIAAQLHSILALGQDFGYALDNTTPVTVFSSAEIDTPGSDPNLLDQANAAMVMDLLSGDPGARKTANLRVGMAVNLIVSTPYMFVVEGN